MSLKKGGGKMKEKAVKLQCEEIESVECFSLAGWISGAIFGAGTVVAGLMAGGIFIAT
jgi:hypothetical protein